MGFWDGFFQAGQAATQIVYDASRKNAPRRRSSKPECTPCAAAAYVESLRGGSAPKKKPRKR